METPCAVSIDILSSFRLAPVVFLLQAVDILVPNTKGGTSKYKRSDLKYDIQGGLLEQVLEQVLEQAAPPSGQKLPILS